MLTQPAESTNKLWANIGYDVDNGIGTRAHIGMLVFDSDQTLSHEARAMLTLPGVALYESRIPSTSRGKSLSIDILKDTFNEVEGALQHVNTRRPSDVVALGCTSAAMVIGHHELERRVRNIHPKARVTDPFKGILSALRALGSARVGFLSPYPRGVAEGMVDGIENAGIAVPTVGSFHSDGRFIRDDAPFISPASIMRAVHQLISAANVDTIVISCTQMRAAAVISDLENQTGKAIVSSNQALCWHALRLAGCEDVVPSWGRLFQAGL